MQANRILGCNGDEGAGRAHAKFPVALRECGLHTRHHDRSTAQSWFNGWLRDECLNVHQFASFVRYLIPSACVSPRQDERATGEVPRSREELFQKGVMVKRMRSSSKDRGTSLLAYNRDCLVSELQHVVTVASILSTQECDLDQGCS